MADSLSLAQARRIALAAQGFTDPRPTGAITVRHLRRVLGRTGLLQVDSVNVLQRAHYLPLFSRLGPYPTGLLDRAAWRAPRELFEYWGHEASLIPVALHPYLRWRMDRARDHAWGGMKWVADTQPELVARVLDEVKARGPMTAVEIEAAVAGPARGAKVQWGWNWTDTKRALEWLFYRGEVTAAARNGAFARVYDLPERVLPTAVVDAPTPTEAEAMRELVRVAAAALGVAGEVDLRDYFRLPVQQARRAVAELTEAGALRPVEVEGWKPRGYLYAGAKLPRRVHAAALISPFDPLIWERNRTERLFDFRYRIEIYTPPPKRIHGYYVLPFLLGEAFAARVDLKADRKAGVLRIPGAWAEPGRPRGEVAQALADALRRTATWLGLDEVAPPDRGDLAKDLADALRVSRRVTV
jgi:uncharacterized protein